MLKWIGAQMWDLGLLSNKLNNCNNQTEANSFYKGFASVLSYISFNIKVNANKIAIFL
jgi:hypothetical protein